MNIFSLPSKMTGPWLWSVLIVSTSCRSSSFGIASVRAAPSISPSGPPPSPILLRTACPSLFKPYTRKRDKAKPLPVHTFTARRPPRGPPHVRAPTIPDDQSQRRSEAAVVAVSRAHSRPPPLASGPSRRLQYLKRRAHGPHSHHDRVVRIRSCVLGL